MLVHRNWNAARISWLHNSSYSSILVKPIYSIVIHIVPHVVQTACFSRLLVSSSQPASGQCLSIALTCSSQFFAEMLHHGKNPISSSYIASDLLLSPALYNISISTCSYSLVWLNVPVHQIISYLTISTAWPADQLTWLAAVICSYFINQYLPPSVWQPSAISFMYDRKKLSCYIHASWC